MKKLIFSIVSILFCTLLLLCTKSVISSPILFVGGEAPSGDVWRYDGTTGAFIDNFLQVNRDIGGLAFGPDGNLYIGGQGPSGDVWRYDGTTGAFIDNFLQVNRDIGGLTFDAPEPIPEPTTIALIGIGLVGLTGAELRRRRKKKAVDDS